MPRPTTKTDLLKAASEQFEKMRRLIETMTDEEQNAAFHFDDDFQKKEAHWKRDKNLRDVLVHVYEWHQLLLGWIEANKNGEPRPFLPAPYNWKTYGDMNVQFWRKHQSTPYIDAKRMLLDSHTKAMNTMEWFSDAELFEKQHFPWTGTASLGSYCISATVSHYDWAMKKINRHIKSHRSAAL